MPDFIWKCPIRYEKWPIWRENGINREMEWMLVDCTTQSDYLSYWRSYCSPAYQCRFESAPINKRREFYTYLQGVNMLVKTLSRQLIKLEKLSFSFKSKVHLHVLRTCPAQIVGRSFRFRICSIWTKKWPDWFMKLLTKETTRLERCVSAADLWKCVNVSYRPEL